VRHRDFLMGRRDPLLGRRAVLLAAGWVLIMAVTMYLIAAFDPLSWHAQDAGYPSVTLLVLFAAAVVVAGAAVLWAVSWWRVRRPGLLVAGVAGLVGGILGNVTGILTIHGLGGGNSAADIWSYPVVWYVGNPADASITIGAILLLVWVARLVVDAIGRHVLAGVMVVVAALPLLVAGGYTVARSAEITGWQAPVNEQLTRVVAHRAGLSESTGSRACAAQFAHVYHRPQSVVLTAETCPVVLRFAAQATPRWDILIGSAPPGTLGPVPPVHITRAARRGGASRQAPGPAHPASDPASDPNPAPSITVTIGPDGSVIASVSKPTPSPAPTVESPAKRILSQAQRRQLPCVRNVLAVVERTEPRFAVLAVDALCQGA